MQFTKADIRKGISAGQTKSGHYRVRTGKCEITGKATYSYLKLSTLQSLLKK